MDTQIFFDDAEDLLDIRRDEVFKAVFTRETAASRTALSRLISAVIGRDVEVVTLNANEPAAQSALDRQLRFDIRCKTRGGEPVNVEMSLHPKPFEPVRLEFHAARLFAGQDIKGAGRNYGHLKPAYQIAILAKERFFGGGSFLHSFEYYDPIRAAPLGGRSRIFTLELSKLKDIAKKNPDEMTRPEMWSVFFEHLTNPPMRSKINAILKREEGIAMAGEVLMSISRDEVERAIFESREKNELDIQSEISYAAEQGEKRGEERGLKKGRREGKQEGIQQEREKMLNLIAKGFTLEDIRRELASR